MEAKDDETKGPLFNITLLNFQKNRLSWSRLPYNTTLLYEKILYNLLAVVK